MYVSIICYAQGEIKQRCALEEAAVVLATGMMMKVAVVLATGMSDVTLTTDSQFNESILVL